MPTLTRRHFIQQSMGALAAATVAPALAAETAAAPKATALKTLGKTGLATSYLGMGTGSKTRQNISAQARLGIDPFVNMMRYAYDKGVKYFDLSDSYSSHAPMKETLKQAIPRDNALILTKTQSREAAAVRADIERYRQELDTDCLDILLLHCMRRGEEDWPEKYKELLDVTAEMKSKGIIRAHGVSCHNLRAMERAADCEWCDVVLARINPYGVMMDGTPEQVIPVLRKIHDAGKAVIGMKVLGSAHPEAVANLNQTIKFVVDLDCVDIITVGFVSQAELDQTVAAIEAA